MAFSGARRRSGRRMLGTTGAQRVLIGRRLAGPADRENRSGRRAGSAGGGSPMGPRIVAALTAFTAMCALLVSGLSLRVNEEGQLTSRFASAIEQLGSG